MEYTSQPIQLEDLRFYFVEKYIANQKFVQSWHCIRLILLFLCQKIIKVGNQIRSNVWRQKLFWVIESSLKKVRLRRKILNETLDAFSEDSTLHLLQ